MKAELIAPAPGSQIRAVLPEPLLSDPATLIGITSSHLGSTRGPPISAQSSQRWLRYRLRQRSASDISLLGPGESLVHLIPFAIGTVR
jgi:hypothetical protein